jgi:hypothetical protein
VDNLDEKTQPLQDKMANAVDVVKEVGKDAIDKAKDLVDGDDDDTETETKDA